MTTLISDSIGFVGRAGGSTPAAISPSRALAQLIAAQRERWILWLPAALIAGAAFWLAAPVDPPVWLGPALLALGAGGAFGMSALPTPRPAAASAMRAAVWLCALVAATGLGIAAGERRAASAAAPAFEGGAEPVRVEGWVVANEASDSGPRLRLLVRGIEGVGPPPRYVRVSVGAAGVLTPGQAARCMAVLGPPSGPMAPGAYDFARRAWFERLGATGYAFGRCRPAALPPPPAWLDRQRLRLAAVRADVSASILDAAPGRGGAIAAALVTGDRSAIDEETNEALRDSGLGHLLSVSGIHMGVVGGLVFAALLWTLSLISPIALRWPVKKIAALGALASLAAYMTVSGASVPALRAFVMACVAFGAILLDRPAISMRGLALAAVIVTLLFPESVLEPGFQMSFAATMALVALFEMMKRPPGEPSLPTPGPVIGALQWGARGVGSVLLISLVAGLATDPFAVYHFQRFSIYALPANLIAAPIMSFLVAPAAAAAAVLAPFGLSDPALEFMAGALDLIAAVGATFGERPEAVRALPRPPDVAFVLIVLALLWSCLWRGALRLGGALFLAAGVTLYVAAPRPIIAFDADLRAVYVRDDGRWSLVAGGGRSTYARDRLGGMLGLSPSTIEQLTPPESCSGALCAWRRRGTVVAFVREAEGFAAACVRGAVVIARVEAPADFGARCAPAALMDATDIARYGGAIMFADGDPALRIERAWPGNVRRPWTRRGADQE